MSAIVASIVHGSHLFGLAGPASDEDIKTVVVPSGRDILAGNARASRFEPGVDDKGTDIEEYDLHRFADLLASGSPVALELLFAPDRFHLVEPDPVWRALQDAAPRIASRDNSKFLSYCNMHRERFTKKSENLDAIVDLRTFVEAQVTAGNGNARLEDVVERILADRPDDERVRLYDKGEGTGAKDRMFLRVCGRNISLRTQLKVALASILTIESKYGDDLRTAHQARTEADWKELSHALRIGYEAIEFFRTGRITFPLVNREHLLKVKAGLIGKDVVEEEIAEVMTTVAIAHETSTLPDAPDVEYLEAVVLDRYAEVVAEAYRRSPVH